MDEQTVFDRVAKHLFTQGRRSMAHENGGCLYYGPDGLQCAIGALIPFSLYSWKMEETGPISHVIPRFPEIAELFKDCDVYFLTDLQKAHDEREPWDSTEAMKKRLTEIAGDYDLDQSVLYELSFQDR